MTTVVRRSALEAAHAALGATFVADTIRWPARYGTAERETATVATAAGIAEIGPLDELLLRGPGAVAVVGALAGIPLLDGASRVYAASLGGTPGEAWLLGPDEVLLVGPVEGDWPAIVAATHASDAVSTIGMTGARTALRLVGPTAPTILAELSPADTMPATMAPGDLIQAPLASVRAFIARQDAGAVPGYTIMVARDEAAYTWDAIRHVGAAHGLVPVGPDAVTPTAAAPVASVAPAGER